MQNYKIYEVDKSFILGTVAAKGYTVTEFCKMLGCSRVNFYAAINRSYASKGNAKFLKKVVAALDIDAAEDKLIWRN